MSATPPGGPAAPPPLPPGYAPDPPGAAPAPAPPAVPPPGPPADEIDLSAAFQAIFQDPDWVKTAAMVGVAAFVPIIGQLVHFGWQRKVIDQLRSGRAAPLPTVDFIEDVQLGIAPFAAVLNLAVPAAVIAMLTVVPGTVMSSIGEGGALSVVGAVLSGVGFLVLMALNLVAIVLVPEMLRRGLKGEMTPLLSFGPSLTAIRSRPSTYATVALGVFLAQMLAGAGGMACYIGVVLTMPMGLVMAAHVLEQWDRMVHPQPGG